MALTAMKGKTTKKRKARARTVKTGAAAIKTTGGYRKFVDKFHFEVETKQCTDIIKAYVRKHFKKQDANAILKNDEWRLRSRVVAAYCYWSELKDVEVPEKETSDWIEKYFYDLKVRGSSIAKEEKKQVKEVYKPTIQERMREQLSEYIGELDNWFDDMGSDVPEFFSWLKIKNIAQAHINKIRSYYEPIYAEYSSLGKRGCPEELKEGYSNLSKTDVKNSIAWLEALFCDLDAYSNTKKVARKARKPKPKSADKLVSKVKYKKEDPNFKIVSIDPINIIDATTLYVFNTKYRTLSVYKTDGRLSVKGTTLLNFDDKESFSMTLRKPEEVLPQILKTTERKIDKMLGELTTKRSIPNGRINQETVILKAIK